MVSRVGMPILLAACVLLAACSGKGPEPLPENTATETPVDESVPTVVEEPDEVLPPANVANTAKALPPPELPDEQQIRDDADATGLTARLPEDSEAAGDNATAPVN